MDCDAHRRPSHRSALRPFVVTGTGLHVENCRDDDRKHDDHSHDQSLDALLNDRKEWNQDEGKSSEGKAAARIRTHSVND